MKRLISVLLVLILVISTMPMAVFAAETATISLTSTFSDEMTIGDVFTVTASITNNPTFLTTTLSLKYQLLSDSSAFPPFSARHLSKARILSGFS